MLLLLGQYFRARVFVPLLNKNVVLHQQRGSRSFARIRRGLADGARVATRPSRLRKAIFHLDTRTMPKAVIADLKIR